MIQQRGTEYKSLVFNRETKKNETMENLNNVELKRVLKWYELMRKIDQPEKVEEASTV